MKGSFSGYRPRLTELFKGLALTRIPTSCAVDIHYWGRVILRWPLEPEVHLVRHLVGPGTIAVDVGANYGVYTAAMARAGARVLAFEPLRECAAALRAYATRKGGRVAVHEVALSDHHGTATLKVPYDSTRLLSGFASLTAIDADHPVLEREVKLVTLDSFGLENVRLIKIDVEGHELAVLRGSMATLRRWHPTLIVEIEQRRHQQPIAQVFDFVLGLGYRGFFLRGGRLWPLESFRAQEDQRQEGGEFTNNFIFAQPSSIGIRDIKRRHQDREHQG